MPLTRRRPTHVMRPVPAQWYLDLSDEEREELAQNDITESICATMTPGFQAGLGRLAEFHSYFPGSNQLPEEGAWIMVKESPPTEYTVPPFTFWYAMPWPQQGHNNHPIHRVKIITPRGDLGLYPHEYSRVDDISKYFEFIGNDMEIRYFGELQGVNPDALFYLRSRGIPKRDAFIMLLGQIKDPNVCWLETRREIAQAFTDHWPTDAKNATIKNPEEAKAA